MSNEAVMVPFTTLANVQVPDLYIITFDLRKYGVGPRGSYSLEGDQLHSREQIVRDIAGWQFEDIDRIYFAPSGLPATDITKDIARQVLSLACEDSTINRDLRSWLQSILGCDAVDEVLAEDQMEEA